MTGKTMDGLIKPVASILERNTMELLGVNNTTRIAKAYNRLCFGKYHEYRQKQYRENFDNLLEENGKPIGPLNELNDGWVLDTSGKLPYLTELLSESEEIIEARGGVKRQDFGRPYFQELITEEHFTKYPSILNFATSSDVLSTICNYLGYIPMLSYTLPYGVRLIESWSKFDSTPDAPFRASQLFHLDFHDKPMAYAIVVLRDVTTEMGPFCFLPKSVSDRVCRGLGNYHTRKGGHRVSDERVYSVVPESELIKLCFPAGTVLFLDNSACFHYGSRNAVKPRYLMMFAYMSTCRTDFGDVLFKQIRFPVGAGDSRLRKMLLEKEYME
jgi:hypothetical protein